MSDIIVSGLSLNSRSVKPGNVFIAVPGDRADGRTFIAAAIAEGASSVLVEAASLTDILSTSHAVPVIPVSQLRHCIGHIAAAYYGRPSEALSVIGVTGTNGKTSCTHFIAQILTHAQKRCGIMGTLGIGFLEACYYSELTTPDAIAIQKAFARFRDEGAYAVAMEVSSHALAQHRVAGTDFHTTVFTNLTHEHLDYHGNMQCYSEAKSKLFTAHRSRYSVINLDDAFGQVLMRTPGLQAADVIGYTTCKTSPCAKQSPYDLALITTQECVLDTNGIQAVVCTPWGEGVLHSKLLGQFNLSNLLATLAVCCLHDIPLSTVLHAINQLNRVPGRMVRMGGGAGEPLVVIDYAHTPDALQQVLTVLRTYCRGKVWCVFGCGGNRDRSKRPLMMQIAEVLSDEVVMTLDNPRTEPISQIFEDMLRGARKPDKVHVESDRATAIAYAVRVAHENDIILIAGKGHEAYQIIGTEKIIFRDDKEVERALLWRAQCVL